MPRIVSVGTAVPEYKFDQQAVKQVVRYMFKEDFPAVERMLSIFDNSEISERYFCMPMEWFAEEHTFTEKNQLYITHACSLGIKAITDCLARAGIETEEIDNIIFVSSTGFSTPSIDALILNQMKFKKHIKRTPIWGLGCAGGAVGLTRAFEYLKAFPRQRVLVVALELCGLTFQRGDYLKSNLIATALFADGAAAVLVCGEQAVEKNKTYPVMLNSRSTFWQDTLSVMGWQVDDKGLHVVFSKDIPTFVKTHLKSNVESFLADNNLTLKKLKHFVMHPGGIKVIKAYQEAFSINQEATLHAQEVINKFGNMSSPTIFFVLQRALQNCGQKGELGLITALGPGFSSESILFQWQ